MRRFDLFPQRIHDAHMDARRLDLLLLLNAMIGKPRRQRDGFARHDDEFARVIRVLNRVDLARVCATPPHAEHRFDVRRVNRKAFAERADRHVR